MIIDHLNSITNLEDHINQRLVEKKIVWIQTLQTLDRKELIQEVNI